MIISSEMSKLYNKLLDSVFDIEDKFDFHIHKIPYRLTDDELDEIIPLILQLKDPSMVNKNLPEIDYYSPSKYYFNTEKNTYALWVLFVYMSLMCSIKEGKEYEELLYTTLFMIDYNIDSIYSEECSFQKSKIDRIDGYINDYKISMNITDDSLISIEKRIEIEEHVKLEYKYLDIIDKEL